MKKPIGRCGERGFPMEGAALALQSALGVVVIPLLAWAMSEDRAALGTGQAVRIVLLGLILQFALAVLFLHMPWTQALFETIAAGVQALQAASDAGTRLVFGYLASAPAPFAKRVASARAQPRARPTANAAVNASPAAVVSTAATSNPGTASAPSGNDE